MTFVLTPTLPQRHFVVWLLGTRLLCEGVNNFRFQLHRLHLIHARRETRCDRNMAPKPEKKKLSKKERKLPQQERGRQGARARGVEVGSRSDITVPTNWEVETHSYDHHDALKFISPGKTLYHSTAKVKETLVKRKMNFCLNDSSESLGNEMDARDPEFEPQPGPSRKIAKRDASYFFLFYYFFLTNYFIGTPT